MTHARRSRRPDASPRRRRIPSFPVAALAVLALPALLAAAHAAPARSGRSAAHPSAHAAPVIHTGLEGLERQVQDFKLSNGLQFIVVPRHQAPVFSFMTVVDAGSANDQIGTTGLAHMMEHMAFKGTTGIGTKDYAAEKPLLAAEETAWNALLDERRKGARADSTRIHTLEHAFAEAEAAAEQQVVGNAFSKWVEQAGGRDANAYTAADITAYFYAMPSNRLELWALLEADRMAHPVFREFYKERDVVYEERRMRYESSPFGRLLLEFVNAAFTAHPYGNGGIGFPSDLKTFTRTQGEDYFKHYYVASNMTIAVVGDVDAAGVKQVAAKYFTAIPGGPKPLGIDTVEPEQHAERIVSLEDPGQPLLLMGWHIPAASDPTYPAYEALADLLAGGDFARLTKSLVKEQKILSSIQMQTGFPGEKYPNLMLLIAEPATGVDAHKAQAAIDAALHDIAAGKPFTEDEVAGYRVRVKAGKIQEAQSNDDLASALAQAQNLYGDWHEFFREQERVQRLTPADLTAAMKRSMIDSNRTIGMIVNGPNQAANAGGK